MKFKLEDRVVRRVDVFDEDSPLMHGTVVRVYDDFESAYGPYLELYAVAWDDPYSKIESGFLAHGLDREPEA